MAGELDTRRLAALGQIQNALVDPNAAARSDGYLRAVEQVRNDAGAAHAALAAAEKAVADDLAENKAAAANYAEKLPAALSEVSWLQRHLTTQLTNLRPSQLASIGEAELASRVAFLGRVFSQPPSDVAELKRRQATEWIKGVLTGLTQHPKVSPGDLEDLAKASADLDAALAWIVAEELDDAPLWAALVAARVRADEVLVSAREMLSSFLRIDHMPVTVDQLLDPDRRRTSSKSEAPVEPVAPTPAEVQPSEATPT